LLYNFGMAEVIPPGEVGREQDKGAQEYFSRQFTREGQSAIEVLSEGISRKQLVHEAREYLAMFEDMSLHPDGSISEYRIGDTIAIVADRRAAMDHTVQDLKNLEYFNVKSDGSIDFAFPGFAYTKKDRPVLMSSRIVKDASGNEVGKEENWGNGVEYLPGTDLQREILRDTLADVQSEMTIREDLVKKMRWVWNQTENLEGLVQFYFMGSFTHEAMNNLFNAEGRINGLTETAGGVKFTKGLEPEEAKRKALEKLGKSDPAQVEDQEEFQKLIKEFKKGKEMGEAISASLQCLEIAALSENKKEFEDLIKSPGFKILFDVTDSEVNDLFLDDDHRKNPDGSIRPIKPILKTWIGEPWRWSAEIKGPKVNVEDEKSSRGFLTAKGNILVESSWSDAEYLFKQIERFLGGGFEAKTTFARKDARDARFIAWSWFRVTGEASDLGKQKYHYKEDVVLRRPEGDYFAHDMGGMTSCDRVKVIAPEVYRGVYRYLKPENRKYGPDGSLGKYPDRFTLPYLKNWSAKTEFGKRTFFEMRWGYRAAKGFDRVLGKGIDFPEEKAYKLGELPWNKLHPKAVNQAALGPFIAGREKIGIFQYMVKTDWRQEELIDPTFWEAFAGNIGISINAQTVYDGRFRGVYNGNKEHDDEVDARVVEDIRNYKKQLMRAFWDGLRSLPQWREWIVKPYALDRNGTQTVIVTDRIKFYIKKMGILTPHEVDALPTDFLEKDNRA
jgi:hypothetical protein